MCCWGWPQLLFVCSNLAKRKLIICAYWNWTRAILRRMQKEDRYHLLKHKRKLRPDLMTDAEHAETKQVSLFIKAHRFLTRPYFLIRRRTFKRLRESGQIAPEGSK